MRSSPFGCRAVLRLRQLVFSVFGSVKIKLLLGFCICFTLILLSGREISSLRWQLHDNLADPSDFHGKGYTLLINTWKRNDLLKKSISHYVACPRLDSVHIVWSEPDPPPESLIHYLEHILQKNRKSSRQIELKFDINKEDSLNNRFKEIKDLKTDVVFSIDDDVILPCSSVELAFSVWQSAPDTMVGFVPRMHWLDQSRGKMDYYIYGGWWSVWWMGTYSMVLSKAAFFHKKYLGMYTNDMPASIRKYVAHSRNCEDIVMSFLVANATSAPPIWVKGKIHEIGSTGISSLRGHSQKRTHCLDRFVSEFRKMPLVSTSLKVVDSQSTWFW